MSIFSDSAALCPTCQEAAPVERVQSVNAARSPHLRAAIQEGTLQVLDCARCQSRSRLPPELVYMDLPRRQWWLVYPLPRLPEWSSLEGLTKETFALYFGPEAPPLVQEMGAGIVPRLLFGWVALREALAAEENGLEAGTLELLKLALLHSQPELSLEEGMALRLVAADAEQLQIGWMHEATEEALSWVSVPRAAYQSLVDDPEPWAPLRTQVVGPAFVDVLRVAMEGRWQR